MSDTPHIMLWTMRDHLLEALEKLHKVQRWEKVSDEELEKLVQIGRDVTFAKDQLGNLVWRHS